MLPLLTTTAAQGLGTSLVDTAPIAGMDSPWKACCAMRTFRASRKLVSMPRKLPHAGWPRPPSLLDRRVNGPMIRRGKAGEWGRGGGPGWCLAHALHPEQGGGGALPVLTAHQVDECEVVGELGRPRHVPGEAE